MIDYHKIKIEEQQITIGDLYCNKEYYSLKESKWTLEEKSKFIEVLFLKFPINKFYGVDEIIDGKWVTNILKGSEQINTIFSFLNGDFKLTNLGFLPECNNLDAFTIDSTIRRLIINKKINIVYFDKIIEKELLEHFEKNINL